VEDYELRSEFQENYLYAHNYWAPFVQDANIYTLAASGYTWSNQERQDLRKQGREAIEYNIMRRPLQFFSGYLRDNINQIIYSPIEGSDQKTADQFTELSYYIWDKGKGYPVFLDAADEALKSGISLCGICMDYSKDIINGDISFFKRTYNSFFLDPTFESSDLSDCSFAITRDLISRNHAKALMPFVDPKRIDEIGPGFRDDKFLSYHPQFTSFARNKYILAYDQYYRKTTRTREFLVDNATGYFKDITEMSREEKQSLKLGLKRAKSLSKIDDSITASSVEIRTVERPYVELHIMLNGQPVYTGEDKTGVTETYPFAPIICYMEPSVWMPSQRIQGLAATQYSAQREFNKRHMKIVDMMDSVISTGYKYLIGSVPDVSDLQQSGQNRIVGVDPEAAPEGLNSVQELMGGNVPPALLEYQKILDNLTLTLSNVTEASLGMDEKRNTLVSGRLAQVQIAQNLMSNRSVFDNVDRAQGVLGSLILLAIQKNYPPEKVARIINEEPTDQFYEDTFEQYDAVIKEGVRSKSQKDAYYYELVNLKREGIVDVPQDAIVAALQMSGKTDLEERIAAQQEQAAEQQKKIEAQEQMAMELANSQKEENLALAQSRRARVLGEIGLYKERISEATQNRADAALARAKTISEIADMDQNRLMRVYEFVTMLEDQEAKRQIEKDLQTQQDVDNLNAETEGSAENKALQLQMANLQEQKNPAQMIVEGEIEQNPLTPQ